MLCNSSPNVVNALGSSCSFPGFISAMTDLVKALNLHVTTKDWEKNVASKLDKFAAAVSPRQGPAALPFPDWLVLREAPVPCHHMSPHE